MPRKVPALTQKELDARVRTARGCGKECTIAVGGAPGLFLLVKGASALWKVRRQGKGAFVAGLGAYPATGLSAAREAALKALDAAASGHTPAERRAEAKAVREEEARRAAMPTIDTLAAEAIARAARVRAELKGAYDARREKRDANTYAKHVAPLIGTLKADAVTPDAVLQVLRHVTEARNEKGEPLCEATRRKVLNLIRTVLDHGVNTGVLYENPARSPRFVTLMKGLPKCMRAGRKHGALVPEEVPAFMADLCSLVAEKEAAGHSAQPARALLFAILTNSRSANALKARRSNVREDVWTIAATEMKKPGNGNHTVYLPRECLEFLRGLPEHPEAPDLFFPSARGAAMSDTVFRGVFEEINERRAARRAPEWIDSVQSTALGRRIPVTQHGISRASYRSWAETAKDEATEAPFSFVAVEMNLHHQKETGDGLASTYARNPLTEERRRIYAQWARYCLSAVGGALWARVSRERAPACA